MVLLAAAESSLDRRQIAASGLLSLPIAEFESDQPGILNSPAVMLFGFRAGNAYRNPCRSCIFATPQLKREQSPRRSFS
jgi:hypothetical protein